MPLTNCARCQKMFNKSGSSVCPSCQPDEDIDYEKVRGVLDQEPNLNAEQVAIKADVDVECVLRMMESGLITPIELSEPVKCGRCGAPAISANKRLCQGCLEKLNTQVASVQSRTKLPRKKSVQIGEYMNVRKTIDNKRK